MRDFSFHTPTSLEEAIQLLDQHGDNARPMAGGTALINFMKQGLLTTEHLVSLERIPGLAEISAQPDGLHIGALVRHRDVKALLVDLDRMAGEDRLVAGAAARVVRSALDR